MDAPGFGILAMFAFWTSAIGGIILAISWSNSKNRNQADTQIILLSLKRRLEEGEISQDEYDKKVVELKRK